MDKPLLHSNTELSSLDMDLFWEKYKRAILIGLVVLAGAVVAGVAFLIVSHQMRLASAALLSQASTAEQLQAMISKYPYSDATASALLLLAAEQRRLGNLPESNLIYEKFLAKFPKHSLAPGAALGIAENALAVGRLSEGTTALQMLVAKYPASYVAPFSLYTQAELLTAQPGKVPEAKKQLQNLRSQFPDSISARYSANLHSLLESQQ